MQDGVRDHRGPRRFTPEGVFLEALLFAGVDRRIGNCEVRRTARVLSVQRQRSGDLGALAGMASDVDGPAQSLDAVP
jgi:hypothetical protein